MTSPASRHPVPRPMRTAAEWSWRFLVIAGALAVTLLVVARLELVLLAVFVAMLIAALLYPLLAFLRRRGLNRALATTVTLVLAIVVVGGTLGFVVEQVVVNFDELESEVANGYDQVREWLRDGPLNLSDAQLTEYLTNAWNTLRENSGGLASGAFGAASTAIEVVSGAAIALFATIFFLYDGRQIWDWSVRLFPRDARPDVEASGQLAWATLTGYIRGIVIIALVDAISIGILLAVLGVPLAVPLALLVFFGAFVPIVGAFVAGAVAVLVALASQGITIALIVLIGIIVIQQVEGHVLHPLVMNKQVKLHPLAIVLAVAAGSVVAGLVGAVVAVPIVAVVNVVAHHYVGRYRERESMTEQASPLAHDEAVEADQAVAAAEAQDSTAATEPRLADRPLAD